MPLDTLKRRFLLALGLPLFGGACATPGAVSADASAKVQSGPRTPPSETATSIGNETSFGSTAGSLPSSQHLAAATELPKPASVAGTALSAIPPLAPCGVDEVREQLCGQGPQGDAEGCLATGAHLTAFGRNVIVSGINIHARDGSLRTFVLDSVATIGYQRELSGSIPKENLSRYCCYSHCQPLTVAASAQKQIPKDMTEGSYCIPMPEGGTKFPASHAKKCPAALQVEGVMRPHSSVVEKGQCCYSIPQPVMPPHPRGRAARIDGVPQVAAVVTDTGWKTAQTLPEVKHLDVNVRRRLSMHWLHDAQMEHASIAAFARTSLELLAFGAPPELLIDAHDAGLDEIAHAQVCFALASVYAGEALGPQAFSQVQKMTPADDLVNWARETFEDGCVGETIAAATAYEAAQRTHDPAVRAVLNGIAQDETRHAELAWKILRFALVQGGVRVADMIRTSWASLSVPASPMTADSDADLAEHGILGPSVHAALRADVIHWVVRPCLEGLLGTLSGDAASQEVA